MSSHLYRIFTKEITSYFRSYTIYFFIGIFLLLSNGLTFYVHNFYESSIANLNNFFYWHIWLYICFIPAISMKLWSEEKRSGTIELLLQLPISIPKIVYAKYFASLAILLLTLIGSLPLILTVYFLGNPDGLVIVASYIGSFLVGASILALGSLFSAYNKNIINAFLFTTIFGMIFSLISLPSVTKILSSILSPNMIDFLNNLSFLFHYGEMLQGYISASTILYFVTFIIVCLTLTTIGIRKQYQNSYLFIRKTPTFLIMLIIITIFISLFYLGREYIQNKIFDFTEEKHFTLSTSTKDILNSLNSPIEITFFYSEKEGQLMPSVHSFASRARQLLRSYETYDNIFTKFTTPTIFSQEEDQAIEKGIESVNIHDTIELYLGISIENKDTGKFEIIPFLDPNLFDRLEYDITSKIVTLLKDDSAKSIGIIDWTFRQNAYGMESQQKPYIFTEMTKLYNTSFIDPNLSKDTDTTSVDLKSGLESSVKKLYNFDKHDILILVQPAHEISYELYNEIKSYMNSGKDVILFSESLSITHPINNFNDTLPQSNEKESTKEESIEEDLNTNIAKAFNKMQTNNNLVESDKIDKIDAKDSLGESDNSTINNKKSTTPENKTYSLYSMLEEMGIILAKDKILANQEFGMKVRDENSRLNVSINPTWIQLNEKNLDHSLIMNSGIDTLNLVTPHPIYIRSSNLDIQKIVEIESYLLPKNDVQNKTNAEITQSLTQQFENLKTSTANLYTIAGHITSQDNNLSLFVIGDSDMVEDQTWLERRNFLGTELIMPFASNLLFVFNIIENLDAGTNLMNLRNRKMSVRSFDKVDQLKQKALAQYLEEENRVKEELAQIETEIQTLQDSSKKIDDKIIQSFNDKRLSYRKKLRDISYSLNREIEELGNWIKILNIIIFPLSYLFLLYLLCRYIFSYSIFRENVRKFLTLTSNRHQN